MKQNWRILYDVLKGLFCLLFVVFFNFKMTSTSLSKQKLIKAFKFYN